MVLFLGGKKRGKPRSCLSISATKDLIDPLGISFNRAGSQKKYKDFTVVMN